MKKITTNKDVQHVVENVIYEVQENSGSFGESEGNDDILIVATGSIKRCLLLISLPNPHKIGIAQIKFPENPGSLEKPKGQGDEQKQIWFFAVMSNKPQ